MALENLYQCTQEQIRNLPKQLSEVLFDHPLYATVFHDPQKRKACIEYFFVHYLEMLMPYALFLADSEAGHAIMVVYDSRRYVRKEYWQRVLKMNVRFLYFLRLLGIRQFWNFIKEWEMLSKRWVRDFERDAYFHLEFVFASENNHEIAKHMVKELIDEGDIMDMNISVDANDKQTALWYEKQGFILMNTIVDEESDLHRYCLIARHHKEQKSWIQSIG